MTDTELVNLMCSAPDNFTIISPAQNEPYSRTAHGFVLPKMPDLELNGVPIRNVASEVIALVEQKRATEAQRDDLLAALELFTGWVEAYGQPETREKVRAAIARAKGGAS